MKPNPLPSFLTHAFILSVISLVVLPEAWGQDQQKEAEGVLEEVIVTARKREETIQDIPLSLNAFTEEAIEEFQIYNMEDLNAMIVGAEYVGDNGNPLTNEIIIRGGGVGRSLNVDGGTGLYANGANVQGGNFGGRSLWDVDTFDVQRWEILKGPHGALYGRNALGGAINVISHRPDLERSYADIDFGVFDNKGFLAGGALNLAVAQNKLAFRVSGRYYDQEEGFYYNSYLDEFDDAREESNARISALWAISDGWSFHLQYDDYDVEREGDTLFGVLTVEDPFNRPRDDENRSEKDEKSLFAVINGVYTWGQIAILFNNRERNAGRFFDLDGGIAEDPNTQIPCITAGPGKKAPQRCVEESAGDYERDTIEARASGSTTGGLNWIVGADWFEGDDVFFQSQSGRGFSSYLLDMTNFVNSYSFFGGMDFDFSGQFNAGAELRYTKENKDMTSTAVLTVLDLTLYDLELEESWTYPTWAVFATYEFNTDMRVYGRIGTGFRSGGLNADSRDIGGVVVPDSYDEERAISYETGLKSEFMNDSLFLNASIFFVEYKDFISNANNGLKGLDRVSYVTNLGDAELTGAELELQWVSGDLGGGGQLSLFGGVARMEGEIVESRDPVVVGRKISRVPEWSFTGRVGYEIPITDRIGFFTSLRISSQKGGFQTFTNSVDLPEPTTLNIRLGISGRSWSLAGVVTNLTEEDELVRNPTSNGRAMAREPRSWYIKFSKNFDW